jgi:urease accessory protein
MSADGGRTTLRELRSQPPLTLRAGLDGVQLVGSSAGPLQGDRLQLDVEVGAGASLRMGSVAAMLVQPGVVDEPSRLRVEVRVGAGGSLRWTPEPMVLVRGCDHEGSTSLQLATDAEVIWREELVLGRHDEPGGSARLRLRADLDGRPLLRNDVLAGPRWGGSLGPAGVGGRRAIGSVLIVGERLVFSVTAASAPAREDVRLAVMPLTGPAALVTALSPSVPALRAALDDVIATCALAPSRSPGISQQQVLPSAGRSSG